MLSRTPARRHPRFVSRIAGACLAVAAAGAAADGMIPASSLVLVNEAEGETSMQVTNSDAHLNLLHVALEDIAEDTEPLLLVTPPLSRVEAGKTQTVRFVLLDRPGQPPLTTQRLKRVIFEGIPESRHSGTGEAQVNVTVRQNVPVIIHPKGLAQNRSPWTLLEWSLQGDTLSVTNPSPYVVRLAQQLQLLPVDTAAQLPKTYVLPGETLSVPVPAGTQATTVKLQPATVYGFVTDPYDAPLHGR